MSKTSKQLVAIFLIIIVCLGLTACHNETELEVASKTTMNIPKAISEGKVYPYYDESLEALVSHQSEEYKTVSLSNADISEITTKMERYYSMLCDDVSNDYDLESVDYLVNDTPNNILSRVRNEDGTCTMLSCQILNFNIVNDNTVEATCILKTRSPKDSQEYVDLGYTKFEKTNSKWYVLGGKGVFRGLASDYKITRDAISGKIIVEPIKKDN